eukprot:75291-Pyramimonas_sp.AAC.1
MKNCHPLSKKNTSRQVNGDKTLRSIVNPSWPPRLITGNICDRPFFNETKVRWLDGYVTPARHAALPTAAAIPSLPPPLLRPLGGAT